MRTILVAVVSISALLLSCAVVGETPDDPWMTGFWRMTADEDGGEVGGVIEFRADGTYVGYDPSCNAFPAIGFHVFNGDIYVTNMIQGKGPVSVIYHPNNDRTRLTFTSPRTKNNAIYERSASKKCTKQDDIEQPSR